MENNKISGNKASDFIERNSVEGKIHVGKSLVELWARHQSALNEIELLKQALAGYAVYMEKMDERLKALEPTIKVFSTEEASNLLKGNK